MTDFEKATLFAEYLTMANTIFAGYMTLIFAMITASYFLAHKLGRKVTVMFLLLFTIGALSLGMGTILAFNDFGHLGAYIAETSATAGELRWLGPVMGDGEGMKGMGMIAATIVVAAYIGCLVFFYLARNRKHYRLED